jgi:hypothetical protein
MTRVDRPMMRGGTRCFQKLKTLNGIKVTLDKTPLGSPDSISLNDPIWVSICLVTFLTLFVFRKAVRSEGT